MTQDFDPHIVAFACHYCAYGAADLAGSMRLSYPEGIRIVKLPCTGKIDVLLMLDAFEHGADGVMVAGCMEGDCHFREGNINAKRRIGYVRGRLEQIGLEPDRLKMYQMSSAMGRQFAEAATEMTEKVRALGPSPLMNGAQRDA